MKRIAYVILLLTVNIGYTFGQIQQDLAELKQDGLDEDGLGYLCTSQGVRFYATDEAYWEGFVDKIKGEDGTVIELPTMAKFRKVDSGHIEVNFVGRKVMVPSDSVRYVNDYFFAARNDFPVKSSLYTFLHDAPTEDISSLDTEIQMYAEFPTEVNVTNSHIRYWISNQIYRTIGYLIESLHYYDEDGEPFGCYMANNDIDPDNMLNYYGDLFKNMYKKYIHHTVEVDDGGGLSMNQSFYLQAVLPHYLTYLHHDSQITIGAAHGGYNYNYISFDKETGRQITANDLFRQESMHQLKTLLLNAIYKEFNGHNGIYYKDLNTFLVESDMISFIGCDENTPIEIAIDSIPLDHVALLNEGVIFTFLPYEIASFGQGPTWVVLPYGEISQFMKPYQPFEPMPGGNLEITQNYLNQLNHRSRQMAEKGNWVEAIQLKQQAASSISQLEGKDNPAYDAIQWQLLELCIEAKRSDTAEDLITEMRQRFLQKGDMAYYEMPYQSNQLNEKRIQLYALKKEYNKILELIDNTDYIPNWQNLLAYYSYLAGNTNKAVIYAKECIKGMQMNVSEQMKELIGEERDKGWAKVSYWYSEFLPMLAYQTHDEELLKGAYDAQLLSKGILLNTETSFLQHILKSSDKEIIELYNKLQENKKRLQVERMLVSERNDNEGTIEDLEAQIKIIEEQLVRKSKRYGDFTRQMQISTLDVCLNMSPTETAIEFASVSHKDSTHYLAFILNGKYTVPKAVYVCNGDELSNCIKNGIPDLAQLYHCVWERIEKEVELKEIISFSPSGQLHNLSIEYAQLPDGRLFSDAHMVCRYSSTREIVLKRDPSYREPFSYDIGGAALFGGIDYETAENTKDREDGEYVNNNKEVKENVQRGALALDVSSFAYLPQTKTEIEQISDILKQAPNPPKIDIYEGSRGTENAFKDISGRKMYFIHTATHGFYFSGDDLDDDTGIGKYFSTYRKNAKTQEEMALSCSGLLLAGANQILNSGSVENFTEDGILTASEISTLDLSTVNMVVLSACQTACGELSGDGVFGLQRGFKKAGAKTLLMSLWQVDDRATQILMVEFYKNLLKNSDNWTALKDAINYLRTTENGRYASPEYWAAFILLD